MPNVTHDFATVAGQTIAFDAATDTLSFGAGFSAAGLTLVQTGSGANATVSVTNNGQTVTLTGITLDKLRIAALAFANASVVQIGDGLATTNLDASANTIAGSGSDDYLDGLNGNDTINAGAGNDAINALVGTDTVNAGEGDDRINLGTDLAAADRIDGGIGFDEVRLAGTYSGVTMVDGTLRNIERLVLEGDGNAALARGYKLITHDTTVADGAVLEVRAGTLDAADRLEFDGSAEVSGRFDIISGAGSDVIKGGAGADTIVAGAGNDVVTGGQGADVITGGAGDDVFVVARGTSKSDSSPTSADRITDFEGAGVIGGDRIQLPVPNGGKPLAFAGYKAFSLGGGQQAPNPNDGFADVFYDHFNGQTRIAIDVNDDGLISEVDQVILLDGIFDIQPEDFDAAFTVIRGTEGADAILGSAYGETINGQGGNDVIDGRDGADTINGGLGEDDIQGGGGKDTINGDADNDTLRGGDENDTINGGEGNDSLYGDQGTDTISGGNGADTIEGGIGGDTLKGDAGEDLIRGGADGDTINGGNDGDQLFGDAGDDTINGDLGNDQLDGGENNDKLTGGAGTDTLHGGEGDDILKGDETSSGDSVIDYLFGDGGNDTLYAGTGRDVLSGGTGADRFIMTNTTSSAAFPNRITDFNGAEGDLLQLQINGSKPLAWFGQKSFFFDGTFGNGGVQFPLANDGLADAIWDYDVATNTTRIAVDVDDDGVFSTGDLLVYLDGQHVLTAGSFVDTFAVVRGGAGNDIMPGTPGVDIYYGMGGDDMLTGEAGADTLYGGEGHDTIDGGDAADTLNGDAGNDIITGGTGVFNDSIYGGAGEDTLSGGAGNDSMYGGTDGDTIFGEIGNDTIYGNEGNDVIEGGEGDDTLRGNENEDQVSGGIGKDWIDGGDGNDTVNGGDQDDTLWGGAGNDGIQGGEGADLIDGETGTDTVDGGAGDDNIRVSATDTITGGSGADRFRIIYNDLAPSLADFARVTDFQQGADTIEVKGSNGTGLLFVFNSGDRNLGTLSTAASQTILGNAGDGLADVLYSTSGSTTWLIIDENDDGKLDAADTVVALTGDIDFTSADFIAGTFKAFRGTEAGETITGTDQDDLIYGVGGNDILQGLAGADKLYGGEGEDSIDGGLGEDVAEGGNGNDTLYGGDGVFKDTLSGGAGTDWLDGGDGNDALNGDAGTDTLIGGLGDDTINGGADNDLLQGGDGNDSLRGDANDDTLEGGIGNDDLKGGDGIDILQGGDGEDVLQGGAGIDTLIGGIGNDSLDGEGGNDVVDAGDGDDLLRIGGGDVLTGGSGIDKFRNYYNADESTLASTARITDFQQGTDTVEILGSNGMGITLVFNAGDRNLGALSTAAGSQTILGNAGDGLADLLYSTFNGVTYLIIDENDDGKLSVADTVIAFEGDIDFTVADFVANTFKVFRGTENADVIFGTEAGDTIYGVGGDDTISGLEGADTIYGAAGKDVIDGGLGEDVIDGGSEDDTLTGGAGAFKDTLTGGAGNDSLDGGEGGDTLNGDAGNDTLVGGLGDDTLNAGDGDDSLDGGEGKDTLRGHANNDIINGGLGDDTIDGGDGADVIDGGDHNDTINGGEGADQIAGGEGDDTITTGNGADVVDAGNGADSILFGRGDRITGGAGADKFRAYYNNTGDSPTYGGAIAWITDFQQGVDKLEFTGTQGLGRLFAVNTVPISPDIQLGEALPFGGDAFADIAFAHYQGDLGWMTRVFVDENDNGKLDATDLVFDMVGKLNLTADDFTPATFLAVRGTPGADTMNGTGGADDLYGVDGNDTINGGASQDELYGQNGDDTLDGGTDNDYLYGGEGTDTLYGGSGGDQLNGEGGNDTLEGQDGNDTLHGGDGADTLRGGFGADTLNGNAGGDAMEGGADNDTLNGGDGNDQLQGQDGADTLKGDAGEDSLSGGALADILTGGAGNDTLDGGTEIDTATFSGKMSEYEIIAENGGITVRHNKANGDGTDFLTNVEKLQFDDGTIQGSFLTVSDGVLVEGDNGQQLMAFTVSLIGNPAGAVTVNYGTTNGTASAGSDYGATSGSLSFAQGETSKTIYVPVNGDTVNEADEAFNLVLSNSSGAAIVDGTGSGTILNDDCVASIGDAQVTEGNGGTKNLTFTISLDKAPVGPVSVSWKTAGGSATEGSDYVAASGIAQFAAGELTKTFTITINGDTAVELDELFLIQLLSVTGAKIGDGEAVGKIVNDDLNHAPEAGDDSFTLPFGTPSLAVTAAALLGNDNDVDGQALTITGVGNANNGTVSFVDGVITFTPAAGFSGLATYTYTVSDGHGGTDTATVTIDVESGTLDDYFFSTPGNEVFDGGVGNDTVNYEHALAKVTVSLGISGVQRTGGGGLDTLIDIENLHGSAFADTLTGDGESNLLVGYLGDDTLDGAAGADVMNGGDGNDTYFVDDVGDTVVEAAGGGNDYVQSTISYVLGAEVESLKLLGTGNVDGIGNDLANILLGNSGHNVLDGRGGADDMRGGVGDDLYYVDDAGDKVIELEGKGTDTIRSAISMTLAAYVEHLILTGNEALAGAGNELNNNITGNGAANLLGGGAGNDRLDGGAGADTMKGGVGDDIFVVDEAGDRVQERLNEGTDIVEASISYALGDDLEVLRLTGTGNINGTGNILANMLFGNSGNNVLNGGAGDDRMEGGQGDDTYYVDSANDRVTELDGAGTDTIYSAISLSLGGFVENVVLTGTAANSVAGNALDNRLIGNSAANLLAGGAGNDFIDGGAGADTMRGGLGDDIFVVDNTGDVVTEWGGEGTDTVLASVSYTLSNDVEILRLEGSSAINGTGNLQENILWGNGAANALNGAGGADQLHGGLGADTLTGGAGADSYWFETVLGGGNVDTISDFVVADDTIQLDRDIFSGIGANGTLAAGAFRLGTAALDADDRILYDAATGNIWYDADGVGAGAATLFAKVAAGTALTNADFFAVT